MKVRIFKSNILDIIWDSVKEHSNVSAHVNTSMISKSNGFLFKFHRYGQDLYIYISPDGDIHLTIKEESHDDLKSIYYTFKATDNHEALLVTIQKDLDMLIQDFYKALNYQVLADLNLSFSLFCRERDWRETYSAVRP